MSIFKKLFKEDMRPKKRVVPELKAQKTVPIKNVKSLKKGTSLFGKKKKKELIVAPAQFSFWLHDGGAIQDLRELEYAFTKMSVDQYRYHVGKNKNDFAKWTEEILEDKTCANDLRKVRNLKEAVAAVKKHLKEYNI